MQYSKEWIKEYNKTWYWKITLAKGIIPKNIICGKSVKLFGKVLFYKWKIAKPNYKWNNN